MTHEQSRIRRALARPRPHLLVAVAATALAGLAPASAQAASAFVTQSCEPNGSRCTATVNFRADPGEANEVNVTELARDRFVFSDSHNIRTRAGCERLRGRRNRGRVLCDPRLAFPAATQVAPADVRTLDQGDRVVTRARSRVLGGSGPDSLTTRAGVPTVLAGDSGDDQLLARSRSGHSLFGGTGNDRIYGGDGPELIRGQRGNDVISGNAGNDFIGGNEGHDRIGGNAGDDRLRGWSGNDRLYGGAGNDHLRGMSGHDGVAGDDGNDRVYGGTGRDRLFGGDGNDRLNGHRHRDRYVAGRGEDLLNSEDNVRERVNCGLDFDRAVVDFGDRLAFCNRVRRG